MASIVCRVSADDEVRFEETYVNDCATVEAVAKSFLVNGVKIEARFTFDPPLVVPDAAEA